MNLHSLKDRGLAGIESTIISPYLTSHALLSQEERNAIGITNELIRFSIGIEETKDLKKDIQAALKVAKKEEV